MTELTQTEWDTLQRHPGEYTYYPRRMLMFLLLRQEQRNATPCSIVAFMTQTLDQNGEFNVFTLEPSQLQALLRLLGVVPKFKMQYLMRALSELNKRARVEHDIMYRSFKKRKSAE